MPRRRPEFELGEAGAEAAKLEKFSDASGSQNLWLSDAGRFTLFGQEQYSSLRHVGDASVSASPAAPLSFTSLCQIDPLSLVVQSTVLRSFGPLALPQKSIFFGDPCAARFDFAVRSEAMGCDYALTTFASIAVPNFEEILKNVILKMKFKTLKKEKIMYIKSILSIAFTLVKFCLRFNINLFQHKETKSQEEDVLLVLGRFFYAFLGNEKAPGLINHPAHLDPLNPRAFKTSQESHLRHQIEKVKTKLSSDFGLLVLESSKKEALNKLFQELLKKDVFDITEELQERTLGKAKKIMKRGFWVSFLRQYCDRREREVSA